MRTSLVARSKIGRCINGERRCSLSAKEPENHPAEGVEIKLTIADVKVGNYVVTSKGHAGKVIWKDEKKFRYLEVIKVGHFET